MDFSDSFVIYPRLIEQLAGLVNMKKENGRLKVCLLCEEFYDELVAQKAKGQKTPSYHPMERSESYGSNNQNKTFQLQMHAGQVYNKQSNVYRQTPYWSKPGKQNQKVNQGNGGWLVESARESIRSNKTLRGPTVQAKT